MERATINYWDLGETAQGTEWKRCFENRYAVAAQHVEGTVYEAGCGYGYGTYLLAQMDNVERVIARDADPAAVAIARHHIGSNPKVDLGVVDIERAPVPSCDWLMCTEALGDLSLPARFLARAKAAVSTGVVLSWPVWLLAEDHPKRTDEFDQGLLDVLMNGWPGTVVELEEMDCDKRVLANYEVGAWINPN